MKISNRLRIAAVLCGSLVFNMGCTSKTQEQVSDIAEDVKDKTRELGEKTAEGTREIAEEIADKGRQVVSKTGEKITDGWITTKLTAKFADEKLLKDSSIKIETADRTVILKGTVPSESAKERAADVAMGTEGVERVDNQLVVKAK